MCFINDNMCPLILKRHIYTLHIAFICLIIFDAHVHDMYYKQPCRLQPTTSYHTVLGFPIFARVTILSKLFAPHCHDHAECSKCGNRTASLKRFS